MANPIKVVPDTLFTYSENFPTTDPHIAAMPDGRFLISATVGSTDIDASAVFVGHDPQFGTGQSALILSGGTGADGIAETQTSVAGLPNGALVSVWASRPDSTLNSDIRAKFIGPGASSSDAFLVNVGTTAGNQVRPEVVGLGTTGLTAFAWVDLAAFQVRVAVFDFYGRALNTALIASETAATNVSGVMDLGLAAVRDGRFVVSWTDDSNQSYFRIGNSANFLGSQIALPGTGKTDIAALSDGSIVATYFRSNGHFAQIYDSSGNLKVPEFRLSTSFGMQSVTALHDGRFMAVYDSGGDIFGRLWNPDGTADSDELKINSGSGGCSRPDVATAADGTIVVAWEDDSTGGDDIRFTVFDPRETGIQLAGTPLRDNYQGTRFDDYFILGDGDDAVGAGDGNDQIVGGPGADRMYGGAGDDVYFVDDIGDFTSENPGEGFDVVFATASHTIGAHIEELHLQGSSPINGTGNAQDNLIRGNAAHNVLDGRGGADTMIGGAGNDTYVVDNAADAIVENAGEGTDMVNASVTFALGPNVEHLTLTGGAAINGTGNALNNSISGNDAANILDGLIGEDVLFGAGGNDTLLGNSAGDQLFGSTGDDTYVISGVAAPALENAGEGTDTVRSNVSYVLGSHVENLVLTGGAAINGTGNNLNNSITGNDAANRLDGLTGEDFLFGAGGNDTLIGNSAGDLMFGSTGNDTYEVHHSGAAAIENAGEGTDTVKADVTYMLGSHVENLILTGAAAINGTGNDLNNSITGNNAANVLDGLFGEDFLFGGDGDDTLLGNSLGDLLFGAGGDDLYIINNFAAPAIENAGEGFDTVRSSVSYALGSHIEILSLTGTANINGTGNSGNNLLEGNSGNNVFAGNGGTDRFVFAMAGTGADTITDFDAVNGSAGHDLIDLSGRGLSFGTLGISQVGADTLVTIGADTILLQNVVQANVDAADFLF